MGERANREERIFSISDARIWVISFTILICTFGLIMVYSATASTGVGMTLRQFSFLIGGFVIMFLMNKLKFINREFLAFWTKLIYIGSIGGILLLKTGMGVSVKGATRWLDLGFINIQVAEIVKVAVILMIAIVISENDKYLYWRGPAVKPRRRRRRRSTSEKLKEAFLKFIRKKNVQKTIITWFVGGIPAGLLLVISNDLSSGCCVLGITFGLSFLYLRTEGLHGLALAAVIVVIIGAVLYVSNNMPIPGDESVPFRIFRVAAWLDPVRYQADAGYQTTQSLYYIGSGGLTGNGLSSFNKYTVFLPEAQTDFIFTVICFELGLVGAAILVVLYAILILQMININLAMKTTYEAAIISGVCIHIALQMVFHIGVCTGLLPNTGLPLPLVSQGGTSLSIYIAEIGLVLMLGERNLHMR